MLDLYQSQLETQVVVQTTQDVEEMVTDLPLDPIALLEVDTVQTVDRVEQVE